MSSQWESTMLLRVPGQAYIRSDRLSSGRQAQDLIECASCRRSADWLIAVADDAVSDDAVEVACRCGCQWQLAVALGSVVGLAEHQPIEPRWQCLDDARLALGFGRQRERTDAGGTRRRRRPSMIVPR
ncbi:hypothetical protein [Catenulispora subtropica]|uniref:Uncharacterized protein n=1 Tax=Catenulispora subtropica TaxID=450798 RepID=A0ABN2RWC8_9ACTN